MIIALILGMGLSDLVYQDFFVCLYYLVFHVALKFSNRYLVHNIYMGGGFYWFVLLRCLVTCITKIFTSAHLVRVLFIPLLVIRISVI